MHSEKISFVVSDSIGSVSGEILAPEGMQSFFVFGHGAGAGMSHPFMVNLSTALAGMGIGTLRYNFPYMEKGGKRPDPPAIAEKTVRRAIETARERFPVTPLLAGGKSFGGRMTSHSIAKDEVPVVAGIAFVGFPLHPAGSPGTSRAAHLDGITLPMLFLQGTRDALAKIEMIEEVCRRYPHATLRKFEGADHSFKAGKQDLIPLLAQSILEWSLGVTKSKDL